MKQEAYRLPNGMFKIVHIPDLAGDDPLTFADEIIIMYDKKVKEQQTKIVDLTTAIHKALDYWRKYHDSIALEILTDAIEES